jgi:hypothetical protein
MAFINPVELLISTAENVLVESELRESALFGALASTATMQKQLEIKWGNKVASGTVSGRHIYAPLSQDTQAVVKGASMRIPDWYIKHQFQVFKQDMQIAASNAIITDLRNPLRLCVEDALNQFTRKMQQVLYTADGTVNDANAGIFGLNAIAGQTGSYAGISRTEFPRWKSLRFQGSVPGTPEALTLDRFDDVMLARRTNGISFRGNSPMRLLIVTTPQVESKALRKLFSLQVEDESNFDVNGNRELFPYTSYSVRGIPVISDVDCPANTAYLLNLSKLGLYGFDQSDQDLADENIDYMAMRYYLPNDNPNVPTPLETNLWVRVARITDGHPDMYSFELSTRCQLVATDPIDAVTKIEDISNAAA